jgi:predicted transposase YbfD/YdcC
MEQSPSLWAIENRLHWRRDVALREDHSQVLKENAPQVLAALNNLVLAVFDLPLGAPCAPTDTPL